MADQFTPTVPPIPAFDVGRALENGWKGYARNFGLSVALVFVSTLLLFIAAFTILGLVLAVPHLAVGLSMLGYYMAKGKIRAGNLFVGFTRYGSVLGAGFLLWFALFLSSMPFSLPYYYHLIDAMGGFSAFSSPRWLETMVRVQATPEMQGWMGWSYLAFPVQFYLQGRWLVVFPLIIERRTSVIEAFSLSWQLTAKIHWQVFLYYLLVTVLTIFSIVLGLIALIVGVFFVLPFPISAWGAAMLQIMGENSGEDSGETKT